MSPRSRMIDILSQAEQIVSTPSPVSRGTAGRRRRMVLTSTTSRNRSSTWMDFCADLPLTSDENDDETEEQQRQHRQQ